MILMVRINDRVRCVLWCDDLWCVVLACGLMNKEANFWGVVV